MSLPPLSLREQIELLRRGRSEDERARSDAAIAQVLARVTARLMAESYGKPNR
ncbi:hypothetical protein [Methylobacterium indicum]|uniref:Uncharacterized protein n=1 Tax=Methylobacterium indicum TaxID=1775910 RepID=A0A8H9C665_9HYPH|nr:hypothetical protein [Methylobacterium indicum]BCM83568.1 hypothetical protein mvi_20290 [Methylobacterium indicum]